MRRWSFCLANAFVALGVFAAEDLPTPDSDQPLEIEPPLLIGQRAPDGSLIVPKSAADTNPNEVDLLKLESDLARAKKGAASGERLYRAGIIAKVEAEERALKVVRLEAKLAEAKLQEAQQSAERPENLTAIEAAAEHAAKECQRAELEAALRNLQRQQKLLALGSGRKADVNRAERKLSELRQR